MASSEVLAAERGAAVTRRNAAIEALSERASAEKPELRGNGKPKTGTGEWFASEAVLSAWIVEQLVRLQGEVDELRAELRASKKGAK